MRWMLLLALLLPACAEDAPPNPMPPTSPPPASTMVRPSEEEAGIVPPGSHLEEVKCPPRCPRDAGAPDDTADAASE